MINKKFSSNRFHHWDAFEKRVDLKNKYKSNAYILWVLGLYLDDSDINALADRCLTDGSQDKSIDFLEIDQDHGRIIIGQGYFSNELRDKTKSGKADSINTAISWLANGDLESKSISHKVKTRIEECRNLIDLQEISSIEILYIHNLPENQHSEEALSTCEATARALFRDKEISVFSKEIGLTQAEEIYKKIHSDIVVEDLIPVDGRRMGSSIENSEWKASLFTVKGAWLRGLYLKYGDSLFSANYRGYLGASKKKKINYEIQQTIINQPENFWVFNNGVTVITHEISAQNSRSYIKGISIINGAQTTGSIGSVDLSDLISTDCIDKIEVMCRIVVCKNPSKISEIVRYNNTQNKITAWDQFSNDPHQKIIQEQFNQVGIKYNLKRSFENEKSALSIEQVVQPILSLLGHNEDANRGKNTIFESQEIYKKAFDKRNARNLLAAYAFYLSIDNYRKTLSSKSNLPDIDNYILKLFDYLSFKNFLMGCIGYSIEHFIGKKCDPGSFCINSSINSADIDSIAEKLALITRNVLRIVGLSLQKMEKSSDENKKITLSKFLRKNSAINEMKDVLATNIPNIVNFIPDKEINDLREIIYVEN